jgi:hypothetical protein
MEKEQVKWSIPETLLYFRSTQLELCYTIKQNLNHRFTFPRRSISKGAQFDPATNYP